MRYAAALLALGCSALPARADPRPNVVIVLVDDQGYGDLSCHGNPVLKTPALDRLHAGSVRLTDFHASPMCTPTRGQLLTGRDALSNGAMNVSSGRTLLRRGIPTAATLFAAAGYRTGHFGKWHLGENYPYRPHDRGFQETVYYASSHVSSAPDSWNNDYFDDFYRHNGKLRQFPGYCTDVFFEEAIRWMKAAGGAPFLTYLALNAAHGPHFVPPKYREPYRGHPANVASFFGQIANVDENVAKLDAFIRGLSRETILVFMTDNGGTLGVNVHNAGMRGRKIDLYEGGHRVPCFVRWPGRLRPRDVAELAQVQDVLPTLLDFCGIPGEGFDGTSLAPLLRGEADRLPDRTLVIQFSRMNAPVPAKGDAAVLWRRWRLVQDKELYDLEKDPAQRENVLDRHPDVAARMRAHYDAWWARVSPRVNEHGAIVIGSDAENPSLLSPADWEDVFLDQQAQVRRGERKNGPWNVEVERAGEYEFTLRRWPEEADAPIAAGLPPFQATDGRYAEGKALPVAAARVAIAGHDASSPVAPGAKAVSFRFALRPGRTKLQTWFSDAEGKELCGAYYVTVRRR